MDHVLLMGLRGLGYELIDPRNPTGGRTEFGLLGKRQREVGLVESESRPHVVSRVFDLQLQLSDSHLQRRDNTSGEL